ncbi:MAG: hypothetical protein ACLQU2_36495 [Candidatus Binataceae bacterium]
MPAGIDRWSLTSLQQRLVKTGGRLIKHTRYYWLLLAESHLTPRLFGSMLHKIGERRTMKKASALKNRLEREFAKRWRVCESASGFQNGNSGQEGGEGG